ncbi:MAG: vitamin K epoxide reductase family protein [Solirubrobacteraceae bacterium]
MSSAVTDPAGEDSTGASPLVGRRLGLLLLIAGIVGLLASGELAIEKFRLLENPLYVPACSLGEAVDCGAVMSSAQADAFGFPNPFLGLAGFGGLLTAGLLLVSGGRPGRSFWLVLQAGLVFAVLFVHWLMFQALYRVGALCPFCMAVWAATIPAFWYVTLHSLSGVDATGSRAGAVLGMLMRNHGVVITVWLLAIVAMVAERFWAPWDSVFT